MTSAASFEAYLSFGKIGESVIAEWFKQRGYSALPVYERDEEHKGPQLYAPDEALIAPDLFVFNAVENKVFWIEAKRKSAFTWHRITETWNTGIDLRYYEQYLKVSELSPWPVWLLFLHENGRAKDTPMGKESPTGLFGGELSYLRDHEHHRHSNWGKDGMVYWTDKTLTRITSLDEIKRRRQDHAGDGPGRAQAGVGAGGGGGA